LISKTIDIKHDSDDYILVLDGKEQGPVDKNSLKKLSDKLHLHFNIME